MRKTKISYTESKGADTSQCRAPNKKVKFINKTLMSILQKHFTNIVENTSSKYKFCETNFTVILESDLYYKKR